MSPKINRRLYLGESGDSGITVDMQDIGEVTLKKGRAGATYGRHPWVFSSTIERVSANLADGDSVRVLGDRGDFLGFGIFNSKSDIRVRMFSWDESKPISKDLWFEKIKNAVELRSNLLNLNSTGTMFRLIFSESDGLSGLVVDKFGDYLVAQVTSLAIFKHLQEVIEGLVEFMHPKGIFLRAEKNILKAEGITADDQVLYGEVPETWVEIVENEIRYNVNLLQGQKTGFYADQRDNRMLARTFCKGRRVLDLCTYTGGFALNLAKAGATEVIGVDSSDTAIETAEANAKLNGLENVQFKCMDVFEFLAEQTGTFDMVILDPPRFAPSKGSRDKALRAYFKLNLEAIRVLAPNGIFSTYSCSHQISRSDFNATVSSVLRKAGRDARVLFQGGQAADHPILASCPETQYLKSLFCLVD